MLGWVVVLVVAGIWAIAATLPDDDPAVTDPDRADAATGFAALDRDPAPTTSVPDAATEQPIPADDPPDPTDPVVPGDPGPAPNDTDALPQPPPGAVWYEDPAGSFVVAHPASWTVERENGLVLLVAPDDGPTAGATYAIQRWATTAAGGQVEDLTALYDELTAQVTDIGGNVYGSTDATRPLAGEPRPTRSFLSEYVLGDEAFTQWTEIIAVGDVLVVLSYTAPTGTYEAAMDEVVVPMSTFDLRLPDAS